MSVSDLRSKHPGIVGPTSTTPPIPFTIPETLTNGMRMGMGRLFNVTAAATTDTTITHDLGRIPHFVLPLDNGMNFVPQVKRSTATVWTTNTVTVQFSSAMAGWVWVV